MSLLTTSRLSKAVFIYLLALTVLNTLLDSVSQYYIYPTLFLTVAIQWFFVLSVTKLTPIRAKWALLAVTFAMIYSAACLLEDIFNRNLLFNHYGLVMACTSLIASLEGVANGGCYRFRSRITADRRNNPSVSWLIVGQTVHKKW